MKRQSSAFYMAASPRLFFTLLLLCCAAISCDDVHDRPPSYLAEYTPRDPNPDVWESPDGSLAFCGNGITEPGEECDGADVYPRTCLPFGFSDGDVTCTPSCTFDFTGCLESACGNGSLDAGERCDGEELGAYTCRDVGFSEGILGCAGDCEDFDTSGCLGIGTCGDGLFDSLREVCDSDDFGGLTCASFGLSGGELSCIDECTSIDTSRCSFSDECGDGLVDDLELCDGFNTPGASCEDFGLISGAIQCTPDCLNYDFSSCIGSGTCGNGFRESFEFCDGFDVDGMTCFDFGFSDGTLRCNPDCQSVDFSACGGNNTCGDGIINRTELCDGFETQGFSCQDFGFPSGTLECTPDCQDFDLTSCRDETLCGNSVVEEGERCDGTNTAGMTCLGLGYPGGILLCDSDCAEFDVSQCVGGENCGDGIAEGFEACDGNDTAGVTCQSFGFEEGTLRCTSNCQYFDTGGCNNGEICGDNFAEDSELCDGLDLREITCFDLGFPGGSLQCAPDCQDFDTSFCAGGSVCGNNFIEDFELCDGFDTGGVTCFDFGLPGGLLQCTPDCQDFDLSACGGGETCGNGTIDGFEQCDGFDTGGVSCFDFGFPGGFLQCAPDCQGFDVSGCEGGETCGNGTIDGFEQCDGFDTGGVSCFEFGFLGGFLQCAPDCQGFDVSGCEGGETCGNGTIDGFEQCDGFNTGGLTCFDFGFTGFGTLRCTSDCANFDTSDCNGGGSCGNGLIDPGETCDGFDMGGLSCQDLGLPSGMLRCLNDCSDFDINSCFAPPGCGNGIVDPGEFCDGFTGARCEDFGFPGGPMGCLSDCSDYDFNSCEVFVGCGNNMTEPGELCDGFDVSGQSCQDLGYLNGILQCSSDCSAFNEQGCTNLGCPADDLYESNNNILQAVEFFEGEVIEGIICSNEDFFKIHLNEGEIFSATVRFINEMGDVDVRLLRANGEIVDSSESVSNEEMLNFFVPLNQSGDYYVQIYGFGGALTVHYELQAEVEPSIFLNCPTDDLYEQNDSIGTATLLSPDVGIDAILCAGDNDFFSVSLNPGDFLAARLSFIHTDGDLSLDLFGGNGEMLSSSTTSSNNESVSFLVPPSSIGPFFLEVSSADGNNNTYNIETTIIAATGPTCPEDDIFEENDFVEQAYPLSSSTEINAVICTDSDFFQLDLSPGERVGVRIEFENAIGDLDMNLFDETGNMIASSTSVDNFERFVANGDESSRFFIEIYRFSGSSNTYHLTTRLLP